MLAQLNRRFSRLYVTSRDLRESLTFLGNVKFFEPESAVARGLVTAAIICYVRPWSGNRADVRADKRPDIPLKEILDASLFDLHEHIFLVRNKAIAHSDFDWNTCSWSADFANKGYAVSGSFYNLEEIDLGLFDALVEKVYLHSCDQLKNLSAAIQAHISANNSL